MASIMDMLDDLVKEAGKHPQAEELLSAIPTVAGAMMLARNGGNTRLGAPLGAGLTALGGMGLFKGSRDDAALQQSQQQKKMSDALRNAFPTTGPQPSAQQALPSLVEGGLSPSEAIGLAREMKPETTYQQAKVPGQPIGTFNPATGKYDFSSGGAVVPASTPKGMNEYTETANELGLTPDPTTGKYTPEQATQIRQKIEQNRTSLASSTTTARANAMTGAIGSKPFSSVARDVIPFKTVTVKDASGKALGSRDTAIATTTPFGKVSGDPDIFYVPKTEIERYGRLQVIPSQGRQLVQSMQSLAGKVPGGLPSYMNRRFAEFMSKPEYAKLQTGLISYVDTVASAFSRRVNQSLIDQWKAALAPTNASPTSVAAAVRDIEQKSTDLKNVLKQEGIGVVNREQDMGVSSGLAVPDVFARPVSAEPESTLSDEERELLDEARKP